MQVGLGTGHIVLDGTQLPLAQRLSVCPVCDVGVLWPNGWTDQDETWHASRPRPWPHCAKWGVTHLPLLYRGTAPQFSAHICCGQEDLGLGSGDFVLDGDPAPRSPKTGLGLPNLLPMFIVSKRLDGSRWYLAWR